MVILFFFCLLLHLDSVTCAVEPHVVADLWSRLPTDYFESRT